MATRHRAHRAGRRMTRPVLGRRLDAEHDPRSLNYPAPTAPIQSVKWRRYGSVLDQGQVGSCTGNATADALNHTPFHLPPSPCYHEADALKFYALATQLDSSPGTYPPDDEGSDGLSVAKAALQLGAISGYTHAFGLDHVLAAAMSGPLIVGT